MSPKMRDRLEDLRDLIAYWGAWARNPRRMHRMFHTIPPRPSEPDCDWFVWIGQPMYSCDKCGRPAWVHKGHLGSSGNPFDLDDPGREIPWTDEEREGCRRRWEPAMIAALAERAKQ